MQRCVNTWEILYLKYSSIHTKCHWQTYRRGRGGGYASQPNRVNNKEERLLTCNILMVILTMHRLFSVYVIFRELSWLNFPLRTWFADNNLLREASWPSMGINSFNNFSIEIFHCYLFYLIKKYPLWNLLIVFPNGIRKRFNDDIVPLVLAIKLCRLTLKGLFQVFS